MRPVKVRFAAFGSYRKETSIDFRELGGQSFFLIHGATGAGKTTVLDAICFALYGDASGGTREVKMLRNEAAGASEATWVELEFLLGEKRYLIFRSPEQILQKKRGEGTTKRTAEAVLYVFAGNDKKVLASKYSVVTEKIESLLGFKSSQFRQVVLLPQGEFLRLLLAKSNERQEIMEVLFNTEIYRLVEEGLRQKARALEQGHAAVQQHCTLLLSEEKAASREEFLEQLEQQRSRLQLLRAEVQSRQKEKERLQEAEKQAMQLETKFAAWETAQKEMAGCQEKLPASASYKMRYETAERAAALSDADGQIKALRAEVRERAGQLEKAEKQEKELQSQLLLLKENYEKELAKEPLRKEKEKALNNLGEYHAMSGAVREAERVVASCGSVLKSVRDEKDRIERERKALELQQQELQKRLEEVLANAGTEKACALELRELEQELRITKEIAAAEKQHRETARAVEAAKQSAVEAEQSYENLQRKQARLQHLFAEGQAGLLAQSLRTGEPCPVCGAKEHPAPAASQELVPDEKEIKAAQAELLQQDTVRQNMQRLRLEAENRLASAAARAAQGMEQLRGQKRPLEILEQDMELAKKRLASAVRAGQEKQQLLSSQEKQESQLQKLRQQLDELQVKLLDADGRYRNAQGILQTKRNILPDEYREADRLVQAENLCQKELQELLKLWQQAEEQMHRHQQGLAAATAARIAAVQNLADSKDKVERASGQFLLRLQQAGFASHQEYEEALAGQWADPTFRQRAREHVRSFEDHYTEVQAALRKAAKSVAGLVRPDMAAVSVQCRQAEKLWSESFAGQEKLVDAIQRKESQAKKLDSILKEASAMEQEYRIVGRLSDIANGKNAHGITFQRYVLRSLLQDVIDAANERLMVMSRGQYRLQPGERSRKNMAGGLDLEIFDEYSGYARAVATLSGGESFLASLSLALGLADVVQSYAGGIRLDTIFIDEGFGTLDEETLDTAIDTLLELQKNGRLVGIISHVEELQEHIHACLEITKTRDGSSAKFVFH